MTSLRRGLVAGCAAVLVASCSSGGGNSDGGGGSVTVSGTVVDSAGNATPGVTVNLSSGAFSQTQLTGDAGTFSAQGVPTPYTATLVDAATGLVTAYQGLTRKDPTLTDIASQPSTRSATLSGQLTGGNYPEMGLTGTSLVFASPNVVRDLVDPGSGTFEAAVGWSGPATTTGTLYAMQIQFAPAGASPTPAGYNGYGTRDNVTLEDMGTSTGQDVALSPVTTGTVTGTVTAAPGYSTAQRALQLLAAPGVALNLLNSGNASLATFDYTTPVIEGTSVLVAASATGPSSEYVATQTVLSANASGVALSLPAAPALEMPLDGATGVTATTTFSWTAFPSGVHLFQLYSGVKTAVIITAANTATLPTYPPDFGFPTAATVHWDVIGYAPVASVDAMAAPGGFYKLFFGSITEGQSATRTFTMAP